MKLGKFSVNVKRYSKTLIFPILLYVIFVVITLLKGSSAVISANALDFIFRQSIITTILAIAIAIPLYGGRWIFSVGAIPTLGAIIGGNIAMQITDNMWIALILIIIACVILNLFDGLLYIVCRVPNMIVSLGSIMLFESMTQLIRLNKGQPGAMLYSVNSYLKILTYPWCYILLAVVLLATYVLVYHTRFGVDMKSLAFNSLLAVNSGVNEKKNIIITSLFCGVLLGIAGFMMGCKVILLPLSNLSSTSLFFSSMAPIKVGLFLAIFSNMSWSIWMAAIGLTVIQYGLSAVGFSDDISMIVNGFIFFIIMAYTSNPIKSKSRKIF